MYKFIKTKDKDNTYDASDIVYRIRGADVTWHDLIDHFVHFLRGCSYIIDEGEFVESKKIEEYLDNEAREAMSILIKDAHKAGKLNEYLVHPNGLIRSVAIKYKQQEDGSEE